MIKVFFGLALFTSILVIFAVVKNRRNVAKAMGILTLGLIAIDVIMLTPLVRLGLLGGKNPALAFLYALQICSMNGDYGGMILASENMQLSAYSRFFVILNMISPIVFGGFIASFFEGAISATKYALFAWCSDIYYFSDLNADSLSLAKDIMRHQKKTLIVFCSSDSASQKERGEAKKSGFVLLSKAETYFVGKSKRKRIYFEISADQDENLSHTKLLLQKYSDLRQISSFSNIKIFLFSEQEETALALSSTDKKGLSVVLVNRYRASVYNLLLSEPLCNAIDRTKKVLPILLVGAGNIGNEMIKACVWASQFGGLCKAKITVVDKNASWYEQKLRKEAPEFFNGEYELSFYDCDVLTAEFEAVLNEHCSDSRYIAVTLGDDGLNIKTALYLRSYYLRNDAKFENEPYICVQIDNEIKSQVTRDFSAVDRERINRKGWNLDSLNAQNYNLIPFGSKSECYSYQLIVNSEVEKLALNAHAAYEQLFSDGKESEDEMRSSYNLNEINRNSNRANAIHLIYKLYTLGYGIKPFREASSEEIANSNALVEELSQKLQNAAVIEELTRIEHDRWNAYMRSEGFCGSSIDEARIYKNRIGSHKFVRARLNACICSWNELDEVCREFDPKLKEYDKVFIQNAVYILGLSENPKINISKVRNVLVQGDKGG